MYNTEPIDRYANVDGNVVGYKSSIWYVSGDGIHKSFGEGTSDQSIEEVDMKNESYGLALNEKTLKFLVRCIDIAQKTESISSR